MANFSKNEIDEYLSGKKKIEVKVERREKDNKIITNSTDEQTDRQTTRQIGKPKGNKPDSQTVINAAKLEEKLKAELRAEIEAEKEREALIEYKRINPKIKMSTYKEMSAFKTKYEEQRNFKVEYPFDRIVQEALDNYLPELKKKL